MTIEPMTLGPLSESPVVSVIISNYNYAQFLESCVESVVGQSYDRIEIIVCDDGSMDDSPAILERLKSHVPNLVTLYKSNGGQASAWNAAVAVAHGDILAFLDPDDRFLPDKIARVVHSFHAEPQAGVCIHRWVPTLDGLRVIDTPFPIMIDSGWMADRALRRGGWGQWPPTSGIAVRCEVAERVFPVPVLDRLGWSDAYILGVSQFITKFIAIDEPLFRRLIHGKNSVATAVVSSRTVIDLLMTYEIIFQQIREWLADNLSQDLAAGLDVLDNVSYVEHLLALRLLVDELPRRFEHHPTPSLLACLPQSRRRWIWIALFRLPRPVAQWALRHWWSVAPWKRWARRVSGALGIRLQASLLAGAA